MDKQELSYYDMGDKMANMYRPIDVYLGMTKRFSHSAIKKDFIGKLLMIGPFWLLSIFIFCVVWNTKDMDVATKLVISIIPLVFFLFTGGALIYIIKNYNTPHPDMLSCRNILDRDGPEAVYKDFQTAKTVNERLRIGERYLFIKDGTVLRLRDITKTDPDIIRGDDGSSCYYTVFVRDELGKRKHHLKELSSELGFMDAMRIRNDKDLVERVKNTNGYRCIDAALEERLKRIETLDIEGLPGD